MKKVLLLSTIILFLFFQTGFTQPKYKGFSDPELETLIRQIQNPPVEKFPKYDMYSKNEVIFCRGDTKLARINNLAAQLMGLGQYDDAATVYEKAIKRAALFYPFRYNAGVCYIFQFNLDKALLHLTKARQVFPEYSKTYLQLGYVYQLWRKDSKSIDYYRKALKRNREELSAYILIGDIYFQRKQYRIARRYYQAALAKKRDLPDGIIGMAKIYFIDEKYYRVILQLQTVDLSGNYNKALHFYYAESAYKLRDYQTAYEQYTELIKYSADKFFLLYSINLIKHKRDLAGRFIGR